MKLNPVSIIIGVLSCVHASAAVLATYVPTGSEASNPNNAPVNATNLHPLVSASAIGNIGTSGQLLSSGPAGPIRNFASIPGGGILYANAQGDGDSIASSDNDYFSFTLSAPGSETLSLSTLSFDYWVGTNSTDFSGTFYYAVYASVDGGSYNQIGSTFSTGTLSLNQENQPHSLGNQSIDLSSITGADSVSFRVWVGSSSTASSDGSMFRNITVEGLAVPEPTGMMLSSLGGLLCFLRRRRASSSS